MTDTISKPTLATLCDVWCEDYEGDDITIVEDRVVGASDYGHRARVVFQRHSDDTFWSVQYVHENDGYYNDFRDGDLDETAVIQVVQHEKTIRTWKPA